jgi:hypothetical protein
LSIVIRERVTLIVVPGASIGNVIRRNRCQWPAPSTVAAWYSSTGIDCSAATWTTVVNPVSTQAATRPIENLARNGLPSQVIGRLLSPLATRMALRMPSWARM